MLLHVVSGSAAETPVPPKGPPAGLRVGFMAYWQAETELVIKAVGVENHRRVDAACTSLHPLTFTQGGAAAVSERSQMALERGCRCAADLHVGELSGQLVRAAG